MDVSFIIMLGVIIIGFISAAYILFKKLLATTRLSAAKAKRVIEKFITGIISFFTRFRILLSPK